MSEVEQSEVEQPAAPVTIEVPAAHASLFQRIKALIERDEQWIIDNVHAAVTTLENMFKGDTASGD